MAVKTPEDASTHPPKWATIEEAFAALESPLLIYARRLVGDFSAAEDIVQDAFMKLHAQFQQIRTPQAWLYRTVHNLAVDYQRRAGKHTPLEGSAGTGEHGDHEHSSQAHSDPQPLPDEQIARSEGIGLVRLVLESMDERSRELIRLRFNEDLSYKDISARTGLTVGHVGYLLHHALKAMTVELDKVGVAP
jgi:RNA polymerase sigma-70 factor (ECF subfamily)